MKRRLKLAATFSLACATLAAAPAFGTEVYFKHGTGVGTETLGLLDLITRALDRSRSLCRADMNSEDALELEAPLTFVSEADGKRVTVTYEVSIPGNGGGRVAAAKCTATRLDQCADAIVQRTERIASEYENMKFGGGMVR